MTQDVFGDDGLARPAGEPMTAFAEERSPGASGVRDALVADPIARHEIVGTTKAIVLRFAESTAAMAGSSAGHLHRRQSASQSESGTVAASWTQGVGSQAPPAASEVEVRTRVVDPLVCRPGLRERHFVLVEPTFGTRQDRVSCEGSDEDRSPHCYFPGANEDVRCLGGRCGLPYVSA